VYRVAKGSFRFSCFHLYLVQDVVEAGESVREQHGVDPDELGVLLIDRLEAFFHRDVIHYAGDEFLARPLKYSMNCLATMSEEKETATLSKDNLKVRDCSIFSELYSAESLTSFVHYQFAENIRPLDPIPQPSKVTRCTRR